MKYIVLLLLILSVLTNSSQDIKSDEKPFISKKQVLQPIPQSIQQGSQEIYISHDFIWKVIINEGNNINDCLEKFTDFLTNQKKINYPSMINTGIIQTQGNWVTPKQSKDEQYGLTIDNNQILITAETKNGVSLAITTLIQLIETEQAENGQILYKIPNYPVHIKDSPVFPYRGLLIDTSRRYFDQKSILTAIDWISDAKLNTLHLHLTDIQSWPVEIDMYPEFTAFASYPNQTYSREQIQSIVKYGQANGINVIPEIGGTIAPTNFGNKALEDKFDGPIVQCTELKYQNPDYSAEMPSGQWNITNPTTREVLENVWSQLKDDFKSDFIHLGMNQLNKKCVCDNSPVANSSSQECLDYVTEVFQDFAKDLITKVQSNSNKTVIVWQDSIFEYNVTLPDPENSVVQLWSFNKKDDKQVQKISQMCKDGYKFIYSVYTSYYLDCGETNSCLATQYWCPYVTWYNIYMTSITDLPEVCQNSVIGAEGAMWSEVISQDTMAAKLLPRIWAIGERTWNNPPTAADANTLEGAKVWIKQLPIMRAKTQQYIDRGIGVRPINTEYCSINTEQEEICNNWIMSSYEAQEALKAEKCNIEDGYARNEKGICQKCGEGSFALKHGYGCNICNHETLGNSFCCNDNGTFSPCPKEFCTESVFCSEYPVKI